MANEIAIRPQARRDIVELATYIGHDSIEAANRFLLASEKTFYFLAASPEIGALFPTKNQRLTGLRVFRVKQFPNHLVLYIPRTSAIEIVRVLHGARDLDAALRDD